MRVLSHSDDALGAEECLLAAYQQSFAAGEAEELV
jgi:hypothetical protein